MQQMRRYSKERVVVNIRVRGSHGLGQVTNLITLEYN